jgi:glycosyltransferase involved in cell wall biosynthesis
MQSSNGAQAPLVSVIVPTYNFGHLISETLRCLQAQTHQNWECCVVDDGSTDDTASVVNSFSAQDSRIRYFQQQNQRQAAARNRGLAEARGSYIQFLDSDDLIEPKKLELHVRYLEQHQHVDIIYSGVRYFSTEKPNERLVSRQYSLWEDGGAWMPEVSGSGSTILPALLRNNIMVVNSPLLRSSVIDHVGAFDVTLTPVEDWQYWIRCAATNFSFHYDDAEESRALVRYHLLSDSADGRRMLRATVRMRKAVAALSLNAEMKALNQYLLAEAEGLLGIEEAINGQTGHGIFQMCKAAIMDRRSRYRAKWLVCAASAPFVSNERLKQMVTSSISGSVIRKAGRSD